MNIEECYKVLELDNNASITDINKQFKKLALRYHPDMPSGDEKIFKRINNARQLLFEYIKNTDSSKYTSEKRSNEDFEAHNNDLYKKIVSSIVVILKRASFFSFINIIVGSLSLIATIYLASRDGGEGLVIMTVLGGMSMLTIGLFLYKVHKDIEKRLDDFSYVNKKIGIILSLTVVSSITVIGVGFVMPLIGLVGVVYFISILLSIIKFYYLLYKYVRTPSVVYTFGLS